MIAATNRDLEREVAARAVPRGPLLPAQRVPDRVAAAARAARGHPAAGRSTSSTASASGWNPRRDFARAMRRGCRLRLARQRPRAAERHRARGDSRAERPAAHRPAGSIRRSARPRLGTRQSRCPPGCFDRHLKCAPTSAPILSPRLRACSGKVFGPGGAAEIRLHIKPTTLASRIKALGITERPPRQRRPLTANGEAPGSESELMSLSMRPDCWV